MSQKIDFFPGKVTPPSNVHKSSFQRKVVMPAQSQMRAVIIDKLQQQQDNADNASLKSDPPALNVKKIEGGTQIRKRISRTPKRSDQSHVDSKLIEDDPNQEQESCLNQETDPNSSSRGHIDHKLTDPRLPFRPKERNRALASQETRKIRYKSAKRDDSTSNSSSIIEKKQRTHLPTFLDNIPLFSNLSNVSDMSREVLEKLLVSKKISGEHKYSNTEHQLLKGKNSKDPFSLAHILPTVHSKKESKYSFDSSIRWPTQGAERSKSHTRANMSLSKERANTNRSPDEFALEIDKDIPKRGTKTLPKHREHPFRKLASILRESGKDGMTLPFKDEGSATPNKSIYSLYKREITPSRGKSFRNDQIAGSSSPRSSFSGNNQRSVFKVDAKDRLARLKRHLLVNIRTELVVKRSKGENPSGRILLQPSVYLNRPPTVLFYCPEKFRKIPISQQAFEVALEEPPVFQNLVGYKCIQNVFVTSGLESAAGEYDDQWDVCWGWVCTGEIIQQMNRHQRLNHFPGSRALGRKDALWKNFLKMRNKFPQDYSYMPQTFILNTDHLLFQVYQQSSPEDALWIAKPVASACGKGIFLIDKATKIPQKKNYLVSNYITDPHLINELKYDLRVYVLVTCYDPLRIYIFNEGLVRFATEPYSPEKLTLKNKFTHLTNYAINKESELYIPSKGVEEEDDQASKWTFAQYRKKLSSLGIDFETVWSSIKDVIIKTIISAETVMLDRSNRVPEHSKNCFELYGFDILLDSGLKPWLMEVNIYPSLQTDSLIDEVIKTRLVCDSLNLAGLRVSEIWEIPHQEHGNHVPAPKRELLGRYVRDLDNLSEENIFDKLSPDDWEVLFESDEELFRKGDYELIFPLKENIEQYKKFFEVERYNNLLLWGFKKMKNNPLLKITPLQKE